MTSARIDPDCVAPYLQHYQKVDLWAQGVCKAPTGRIITNGDLFSRDLFHASPWYNEFLSGLEQYHLCSGTAAATDGMRSSLSFYRPEQESDFGRGALRKYRIVTSHVYRALQLSRALECERRRVKSFMGALDLFSYGVLLLDLRGRIWECNRAAQELLRLEKGLFMRCGSLFAKAKGLSARLEATIGEAIETSRGNGISSGGVLALPIPGRHQPLLVLVAPLPGRVTAQRLGVEGLGAIVLIKDPATQPVLPENLLGPLYGLTPAERDLAIKLGQGLSLRRYAEEAGVTFGTARSRLKYVFSKTNTHRQSDLVRLVSSLSFQIQIDQSDITAD